MRLVIIRAIAVFLICISPFYIWWLHRTSAPGIDFPPELARIMGKPVEIPVKPVVNIMEESRYWTNQNGENIDLITLGGKPTLATFIYTKCFKECLLTIVDLKKVEMNLSAEDKKNVQYILFSFDPENDTPAALKAWAENFDVDLSRWHFLTAEKDELKKMAEDFGFYYQKKGDYFNHTVQVSVIDRAGNIRQQFYGNNLKPHSIIERLDDFY